VIVTADIEVWQKAPERYWRNAPGEVADLPVGWMGPSHEGRERLQRDEAQRSIGLAMQTRVLAPDALGYRSCRMIGFDIDGVAELIELPDDLVMGPKVGVGKGVQEPWPKPGQLPLGELVVEITF
jgi:nitroreductase